MKYVLSLGSDLEYLDAVKRLEDAPQGMRTRHALNIGTDALSYVFLAVAD